MIKKPQMSLWSISSARWLVGTTVKAADVKASSVHAHILGRALPCFVLGIAIGGTKTIKPDGAALLDSLLIQPELRSGVHQVVSRNHDCRNVEIIQEGVVRRKPIFL